MNTGFIGYGSMGSMFIKGFIESGMLSQEQIIVTRKDKSKLGEITKIWPRVNTTASVAEVIEMSQIIFICIKPMDYGEFLHEVKTHIRPDQHVVSTAGSVALARLDQILGCKITKVCPTITSDVNGGITLICHNNKVTDTDAEYIEALFGSISKVLCIGEESFGFASELTSCGPGLIAAIFKEMVKAGLRHINSFTEAETTDMVEQTLYGTARLLAEEKMSFDSIVQRVATKGGITEEGVKVLEKGLPSVFEEMFTKTMEKQILVNEKVAGQLENI
jgi:pyrroline-5-carboxylate reductase